MHELRLWKCLLRLGITTAEIAATNGLSTPTVYNRLKPLRAKNREPYTTAEINALSEALQQLPPWVIEMLLDPRALIEEKEEVTIHA